MATVYESKKIFIDEKYIYKNTTVNSQVEASIIYPSIYIAQQLYLRTYLGDSLYEKMMTDFNSWSGDYETLLKDYIADALCWWTMVELLPRLTYRYNNGTIAQYQSEDTVPVSDEVMKAEKQAARRNAIYFTQRLIDYLCDNSEDFPEYSNNTGSQRCPVTVINPNASIQFSTGSGPYGPNEFRHIKTKP